MFSITKYIELSRLKLFVIKVHFCNILVFILVIINRFLSLPLFKVLARLTYCMYLLGDQITWVRVAAARVSQELTFYTLVKHLFLLNSIRKSVSQECHKLTMYSLQSLKIQPIFFISLHKIVPVENEIEKFRPITVRNIFAKTLGIALYFKLVRHLTTDNQHEFIKNRSRVSEMFSLLVPLIIMPRVMYSTSITEITFINIKCSQLFT